jgi:hypothetical protein
MEKSSQHDISLQAPIIDNDSHYRHVYAEGNSRLHNGHVFNTVHHSKPPFRAYRFLETNTNRADYRSAPEFNNKPAQQVESSVNLDLIRACEEGQGKARLAYLLGKGADIESRDESNCTPLHHAVFSGPAESVEFLLDAGADINASHPEWKVPLCIAILRGRPEIVKTLLKYKASTNIDCGHLGSPVHAACAKADMATVELLTTEGVKFAKQKHVSLGIWSVLIHGKIEPAPRILFQYSSPGGLAVALGKHEVVEWCLIHGFSLDEPWIHIPSEWLDDSDAERTQRLEDVAARTSHESKSTLIMMAASHLDCDMIELLLAKGADAEAVDSTYYYGYNAIFHAVRSVKNTEDNSKALSACISILQKHGVSIDAQDT